MNATIAAAFPIYKSTHVAEACAMFLEQFKGRYQLTVAERKATIIQDVYEGEAEKVWQDAILGNEKQDTFTE